MKEYIILIKNLGNPIANLSKELQQQHIDKVGGYIKGLFEAGKMTNAQPLETEGVVLSCQDGSFTDSSIDKSKEVISGYYSILAKDLDEAIAIAKADPRFQDSNWRMEIRPVLKLEGIN